jgi:hypothetical protein
MPTNLNRASSDFWILPKTSPRHYMHIFYIYFSTRRAYGVSMD